MNCRLPPIALRAPSGSTLSAVLKRSSSSVKRARRATGPNGATSPCHGHSPRRVQNTVVSSKTSPSDFDGQTVIALTEERQQPPITPNPHPMLQHTRHSFPLAAPHQRTSTRIESRSGGGGQRDAGQQDAPRRRAHSAGLGAPAGFAQASTSATKALVAATVAAALKPELTDGAGDGSRSQSKVHVRRVLLRPPRVLARPAVLRGVVSGSLAGPSVVSTPVHRLHGLLAHRSPMWSLKPLVLSAAVSPRAGDGYLLSSSHADAEMNASSRIFDGDLLRPE